MKKLFYLPILLACFFGAFQYGNAYEVINNTNDGVHNGMYQDLVNIAAKYYTTGCNQASLAQDMTAYIYHVNPQATAAYKVLPDGGISIGCGNRGDLLVVHPGAGDPGYIQPDPPPPPSCSYISSYSYSGWSVCSVNSQWSSNGTTTCSQSRSSWANWTTLGQDSCPGNASAPGYYDLNQTRTLSLGLDSASSTCTTKVANASDSCRLRLRINGVPAEGVSGVGGSTNTLAFSAPIYLNQITKTGPTGGLFLPAASTSVDNGGITFDNIKSAVPFSERGSFAFNINNSFGSTRITMTNIPLLFTRPLTATLAKVGTGDFYIGTQQRLKLNVANPSGISPFTTSSFQETLATTDARYVLQNINGLTSLTNNSPEINLTVNYQGTTAVGTTGVVTNPKINYSLAGLNVSSYLSESNDPTSAAPITFGQTSFAGVKVVGNLSKSTRANLTGQANAIVDVSLISLRPTIRQNAATITRGMTNGQVSNGVKYVEGNYTITANPIDYQTLVVKNGNLTIASNITSPIGIIVVSDTTSNGHVYIRPNVQYIHAMVYADGSMESVSSSNTPYTTDSTTRTSDLQNQLVLKGGLYTQNTIGGAIFTTDHTYLLPSHKTTNSLDEAIRYDLNYIRRGNVGYNSTSATKNYNLGYKDPFVIITDTSLQTNPPKGFGQ